jgi:phenylpropionate dioxygenase-like ring-hydroxylating dioxygenase large terminal subunit
VRTLPGSWYADPAHHERELASVFGRDWIAVATEDGTAAPCSYQSVLVGGRTPVLLVRDEEGVLRAFLNVCRHRGSPVAEGCGTARALRCPYHAWIYRLDGSLARATGVGCPSEFDPATFGLKEVAVTTFCRNVFVSLAPDAPPFDPGPLAEAVAPYRIEDLELAEHDRWERTFNWKVFLENFSENYHTPFVHPELIVDGWDYPIETAGRISLAWDRPHSPRDAGEQALADARPGHPGWEAVASATPDESFIAGTYMTLWPNLMVSFLPGFAATLRLTPVDATHTIVERDYLWHPDVPTARREADVEATRLVGAQDLDVCEMVQRSYSGGLDPDGVLSTEHETGIAHLHGLLRTALAAPLPDPLAVRP